MPAWTHYDFQIRSFFQKLSFDSIFFILLLDKIEEFLPNLYGVLRYHLLWKLIQRIIPANKGGVSSARLLSFIAEKRIFSTQLGYTDSLLRRSAPFP
jgi:hypothetical protein